MATVTASEVETTDSLETFRQRFNTLRSDIQGLSFGASVVFEGATADDFETTLAVTDPTADRTVTIQNKTGVLAMQGRDINDIVVLNATDGSGTDEAGAILLNASASGVDEGEALLYEEGTSDHLLNPVDATPEFILMEDSVEGRPVNLVTEVDSEKFIYQPATGDNLLGSLFIPPSAGGVQFTMPVSDGINDQVLATDGSGNLSFKNQSSGLSLGNDANNRVITATGSNSGNGEANLLFDGSTLTVTGNITVPDDGDIGSVSATDAIQISSGGIITFKDDIKIKDGGTIGNASVAAVMTLASTGIVTFADDIVIKDGGTIGVASAATAITIASSGIVTFVDDIVIKDAGTIGSASDTDAISISSGGVVNISATTANTNATDGALTVAGGVGIALDASVGDDLRLISDGAILSFGADNDITLTHVADTGVRLSDSMALLLGTGDDISFSWDGTDGHLSVAGTLNVEGSGETLAKFIDDGAVELYHNNTKKVETTSDGITVTGELLTTGFSSSDFAAAFIVIEDGGTDGSGTNAGDNIIIEDGGTDGAGANAGDDFLMENVTSWVTSGFTIRDSFGNHLQTVNGVS